MVRFTLELESPKTDVKNQVEKAKSHELTDEEMEKVHGGASPKVPETFSISSSEATDRIDRPAQSSKRFTEIPSKFLARVEQESYRPIDRDSPDARPIGEKR